MWWQDGQDRAADIVSEVLHNMACRSNLSKCIQHKKACNPPLQDWEVGQHDLADNLSGLPPLLAMSNVLYEMLQAAQSLK